MKTELKAKFIQQILSKKKDSEGFTLIELLVVIIIIGILSAIALPSFINQAAKAKQTEAKTTVSSINKGQQTRRIEQGTFATTIADLSVGLNATSTSNYDYVLAATPATGLTATIVATAKDSNSVRGYSGGVFITSNGDAPSIICQSTGLGTSNTAAVPSSGTLCASGMDVLK
jgi:type IV pilus assembly protein PilA